jgi:hypothetical protein
MFVHNAKAELEPAAKVKPVRGITRKRGRLTS